MRSTIPITLYALVMAAPAFAQTSAADQKAVRTNFKQADANKDGKLSKSEFRRFIDENAKDNIGRASMVKRFGAYDAAFARVDTNKDGIVTGKELVALQGK